MPHPGGALPSRPAPLAVRNGSYKALNPTPGKVPTWAPPAGGRARGAEPLPAERVDGPQHVVVIAERADIGVDRGVVVPVRGTEPRSCALAGQPGDDLVGPI